MNKTNDRNVTVGVLSIVAAASMFAGCGSGSSVAPVAQMMTTRSAAHPHASTGHLLYVSDYGNGVVQVYTYPLSRKQMPPTPVATLTGFDHPSGLCTDTKGHVYIANQNDSNVVEYDYGGTQPIATIATPGQSPLFCSVDPTSGNVAIATTGTGRSGTVTICSNPSQCTTYSTPIGSILSPFYLQYLPNGDLYMTGDNDYLGIGYVMYLAHGSTTWQPVKFTGARLSLPVQGRLSSPNALVWDGTYLDMTGGVGEDYRELFQCTASGVNVACTKKPLIFTGPPGMCCIFPQQVAVDVETGQVLGADVEHGVDIWSYPAGRPRSKQWFKLAGSGTPSPFGIAILQQ